MNAPDTGGADLVRLGDLLLWGVARPKIAEALLLPDLHGPSGAITVPALGQFLGFMAGSSAR